MPWHCVMCNPLHVNKLGLIGIGGGARGAGLHPMSIPDESVVPTSLGQGQGQGYTTVPPKALVAKFGTNPLSFKLYTLETWGKRQTPMKFNLKPPWLYYSATRGPGGQIRN